VLERVLRHVVEHRHRDRRFVRAAERPPPGERAVERDAEREHVGPPVDALAPEVLGRDVAELPLHHSEAGRLHHRRHLGLRDSEVDQLGLPAERDDQVVGRDVAVHQVELSAFAIGEPVRVVEAGRAIHEDAADHRHRRLLVLLLGALEHAREREAVDVFHRDVEGGAFLTEIEDLHAVRVIEHRRDARFLNEHLNELLVLGEVLQNRLHHHQLLEAADSDRAREPHLGHASSGQPAEHLVPGELRDHRAANFRLFCRKADCLLPVRRPNSRGSCTLHIEHESGRVGRVSLLVNPWSHYGRVRGVFVAEQTIP
jgi:hypothetical protein